MSILLQELHAFHGNNGHHFIFDPESMVFFQSDDQTFQYIRRNRGGSSSGQTVPANGRSSQFQQMEDVLLKERARVSQRYQRASTGKHTISRLTILTTTACNLNCTYCYADGGAYGGPVNRLSASNASTAIRNILDYYKGIDAIQFFGGEPLLNPGLIESVCRDCETMFAQGKMPNLPRFGATSNGTIWNERIASLLKRYKISLNISIDGPQEVHDRSRIDVKGNGSFHRVFRTLEALKEHEIPFSVEVTYNTITMRAGYSVWDIISFLAEHDIYHPHIVPAAFAPTDGNRWTPPERKQLAQHYREATQRAVASLVEGKPMLFSYITGILQPLLLKIPQPLVCAAGVHDLAIDTAGNIYPCFMFIGQDEFIQHSALQSLDDDDYRRRGHDFYLQNAKEHRSSCENCWARNICTSCLGMHQIENGRLDGKTINCLIIQTVAETLMTELARLQQTPAQWKRFVDNYRSFRLGSAQPIEIC